jgi:phosphoribosyl-ATP pyrophosphohydrolase/phosphoribosyl-AMP cyclohydrolase
MEKKSLNFEGLLPAIIQDSQTKTVLMLGYMNKQALKLTYEKKNVHFFSRKKNRIWMKGETSGNILKVTKILFDCDNDTLLIKVKPKGNVCHTGSDTCFNEKNIEILDADLAFLDSLEKIIKSRKSKMPSNSFIASLIREGNDKVIQKFGEEAIELILEAKNNNKVNFINEAADVLFTYLILILSKNIDLRKVVNILYKRNQSNSNKKSTD